MSHIEMKFFYLPEKMSDFLLAQNHNNYNECLLSCSDEILEDLEKDNYDNVFINLKKDDLRDAGRLFEKEKTFNFCKTKDKSKKLKNTKGSDFIKSCASKKEIDTSNIGKKFKHKNSLQGHMLIKNFTFKK